NDQFEIGHGDSHRATRLQYPQRLPDKLQSVFTIKVMQHVGRKNEINRGIWKRYSIFQIVTNKAMVAQQRYEFIARVRAPDCCQRKHQAQRKLRQPRKEGFYAAVYVDPSWSHVEPGTEV